MKTTILTFLLFVCSTLTLAAQNITVSTPSITKINGNLNIQFALKIDPIPSNAKLIITPVLEGDSTKQFLTPIILIGQNMRISQLRKGIALPHNVVGKPEDIGDYTAVIPFKKWMNKTSLKIYRVMTTCDNTSRYAGRLILRRDIKEPTPKPVYRPSPEEIIKHRKVAEFKSFKNNIAKFPFVHSANKHEHIEPETKSLKPDGPKIYYRISESQIDINYHTNLESLMAIKDAIQLISSNESVSPVKIIVYGTASPEGADSYNEKLAQDRADWMSKYISNFIDPSYISTINLGENWGGLRALVEQSGMPYKQEVLDIIDNYSIEEGRETKLINLHLGVPYRYIKEQFFPQLRCSNYIQVFYDKNDY